MTIPPGSDSLKATSHRPPHPRKRTATQSLHAKVCCHWIGQTETAGRPNSRHSWLIFRRFGGRERRQPPASLAWMAHPWLTASQWTLRHKRRWPRVTEFTPTSGCCAGQRSGHPHHQHHDAVWHDLEHERRHDHENVRALYSRGRDIPAACGTQVWPDSWSCGDAGTIGG